MGNRRVILKIGHEKATSVIRNDWTDEQMIEHIETSRLALLLRAKGRNAVLKGTDATGKRIIKQISV